MSELSFAFFHGVILAFGLIIPLGVQNIFVFNQGATQKRFIYSFPSIITASLCDSLLIILAVLGVSLIVLTIPLLKNIIFIIGFFFLLYMGWVTWRSHAKVNQKPEPLSAKKQIAFALSVSLLNPHAIIDTIGVIGTNSLQYSNQAKWAYTFGCILVSWIWFVSLAIAGHHLNKFDTNGTWIKIINKLSALIIWGVAIYIGLQIFKNL